MAEVKRFSPAHAMYIGEHPDGGFVRYSDFAALERRLQLAVDALLYLLKFPDAPRAKELAGKVIDSEQR